MRALVTVALGASIVLVGAWSISGGSNDDVANLNLNPHANVNANVESSASIRLVGCQTRGCT